MGYVQRSPRCAIPLRSARMEPDACSALLLRVLTEAEKTWLSAESSGERSGITHVTIAAARREAARLLPPDE